MIKILHCADLHLGDLNGPVKDGRNARREDTLRCMREIAKRAAVENPNVTIIAGDLFNRSRVWADTALDDIDAAIADFIRPLCRASEKVVLLFGTQNHDNPKAFNTLRHLTEGLHNLTIYTTPEVETLTTSAGPVQILAMPGFDKGRLRAFIPDADAETENQNATTLVNEIIMGLSAEAYKTKPAARILVAHYTVAGCESESGQTFLAGQDVVILPQTIDSAGVTLACFGHIHKPQKLNCNTPAYYSGSPNQLTFNDEGMKHGFYIHEIENGKVTTRQIFTPERRHLTVRMTEDQIAGFIATGQAEGVPEEARDAILRIIYKATPEQDKQLNRAALQTELLQNHGAFHVADFQREENNDLILADTSADDSPKDTLHRYLAADETLNEADIARIEDLAEPIIRAADDGREADRHAGAFTPMRIEVTNYRSYTHAEFDFSDIRMAMVNGQNGVGKSSLFMDAIADCLYEQSREGATGEWLRVGEKKGAILFEFEMGGSDYRVARTRTASGKGTLALARKDPDTGEWLNMSDTTMRLTQEAINKVVGMDCQTFCSIALIRQDAYGLFLEAGSDQRMEVLSNLLNLGLYGRAEEIAKTHATEQRRTIAQMNDRMDVLDTQIRQREEIEAQLREAKTQRELKAAQTAAIEAQIKAVEREEALRQEKVRQADEKAQEAANLDAQAAEKEAELAKQKAERENASALAAMAEKAIEAADTIRQARADLETLAQDEADLIAKTEKQNTLTKTVIRLDDELKKINREMQEHEQLMAQREEIGNAAAEISAIRKEREELAPKITEYEATMAQVGELKQSMADFLAESRVRIGKLKNRVETAEGKAALLTSSECPIAETASCAFLKDAQAAKSELESLTAQLTEMKTADREAYGKMTETLAAAQAQLEAMGNPRAGTADLDARERRAAPMAALAGRLEAAQAAVEKLKADAREKSLAQMEAEKERDEICDAIIPLQKSAEKAAKLRETIKEAEPTARLQMQCAAAEATVKALTVTIDLIAKDAEKRRQEATVARQAAQEMRDSIPQSNGELDALRQNKRATERDTEELARQIGGLQTKLDGIADAKAQWEDYRDRKKEAARKLADYQTLAAAFGLDGIQYTIIRSTVPEIQSRANAILSAMTGGRMAVEFRTERETTTKKTVNTLDVWINNLTGISRPYASHSGGEKVKIALAVTLGLADVKAHRAGVQLGMLWIDEPPFLDSDGTDAYADALANMAERNPGMRILAISHDPQLKARFPQNITVAAGENGSEVTMG